MFSACFLKTTRFLVFSHKTRRFSKVHPETFLFDGYLDGPKISFTNEHNKNYRNPLKGHRKYEGIAPRGWVILHGQKQIINASILKWKTLNDQLVMNTYICNRRISLKHTGFSLTWDNVYWCSVFPHFWLFYDFSDCCKKTMREGWRRGKRRGGERKLGQQRKMYSSAKSIKKERKKSRIELLCPSLNTKKGFGPDVISHRHSTAERRQEPLYSDSQLFVDSYHWEVRLELLCLYMVAEARVGGTVSD